MKNNMKVIEEGKNVMLLIKQVSFKKGKTSQKTFVNALAGNLWDDKADAPVLVTLFANTLAHILCWESLTDAVINDDEDEIECLIRQNYSNIRNALVGTELPIKIENDLYELSVPRKNKITGELTTNIPTWKISVDEKLVEQIEGFKEFTPPKLSVSDMALKTGRAELEKLKVDAMLELEKLKVDAELAEIRKQIEALKNPKQKTETVKKTKKRKVSKK